MRDPSLKSLQQELILQHYRHSRHRGQMEAPDAEAAAYNPVCGDEVALQLRVRDGLIEQTRFRGHGCTVSQASASMMAALIEGKSLVEAGALSARFSEMLGGDEAAASDRSLGDLRALAGVAKLPARVRCALLPWNALLEAETRLRE